MEADTLLLPPPQLRDLRYSVLERLRGDLGALAEHVDSAITTEERIPACDAQTWSRYVRDTLDLIDAIGWPTEEQPPQGTPPDERRR